MVLVTGGSGYLASWVIRRLLERGVHVRTTVRDLSRADGLRRAVEPGSDAVLEVVQADLTADGGWAAAMHGVDAVAHVASPLPTARRVDLVHVAQEGAARVLRAAQEAGVRRVVVTSSIDAATPRNTRDAITEAAWAAPSKSRTDAYARSKVVAERYAWSFADDRSCPFALVTVLPGFLLGPVLGALSPGSSVQAVAQLIDGKVAAIPRIGV